MIVTRINKAGNLLVQRRLAPNPDENLGVVFRNTGLLGILLGRGYIARVFDDLYSNGDCWGSHKWFKTIDDAVEWIPGAYDKYNHNEFTAWLEEKQNGQELH